MNTVYGKLYYANAYRVIVGIVGPKWIRFCYFHDGGELKIRRVPKAEGRFITQFKDNRPPLTSAAAAAKRFLRGRTRGPNKRVRAFLDRIIEEGAVNV